MPMLGVPSKKIGGQLTLVADFSNSQVRTVPSPGIEISPFSLLLLQILVILLSDLLCLRSYFRGPAEHCCVLMQKYGNGPLRTSQGQDEIFEKSPPSG